MAKQSLASNSFTKEVRPTTGKRRSSTGGFGSGKFGLAKFSENITGYEQDKKVLNSNSHSKEVLNPNSFDY